MKTFGVRVSEPNYPYMHYVAADNIPADDAVLYDWLVADNYKTLDDDPELFAVPAPEGYLFSDELLYPETEFTEEERKAVDRTDNDVWSFTFVRIPYRFEDKAQTLLDAVLLPVTEQEFYALNIPNERILTFTID